MTQPKILMFHGKEGSPSGRKATYLKNNPKYQSKVPAYPSNAGQVEEVFPTCLEIAKHNLREFAPDLVIGSSFGGGILLKLITEGLWRGPSLFLAQAGVRYKIANVLPPQVPVVLVHGVDDKTIPLIDSQILADSSANARLIEITDGHSLRTLCNGLFDLCIDYLLLQR